MSDERKVRPDAILRNLPEARQDAIGEMMLPGPNNKSLAEIQKSLADDAITVSQNAISRFYSWWCVRRQRQANEQFTQDAMDELKRDQPDISDADLFAFGQRIFSRLAIQNEDPAEWARVNLVQQRETKLQIETKKAELLEARIAQLEKQLALAEQKAQRESCKLFVRWYADAKAKEILQGDDSNDAKTEQLGRLLFQENWK